MVSDKLCRRCNLVKSADAFRRDSRYKDGLGSWCAECHRRRNSSWAKENRSRLTNKASVWRADNPEKWRETYLKSGRKHRDKRAAEHASWVSRNRDKRRATDAKRKAAKLLATPRWANAEKIAAIYRRAVEIQDETGERMHVDHIVPLQHELVCGLHCEANLQILPGALNESKRNRWWPDAHFEQAYAQPDLFIERPPAPQQEAMEL